VQIISPKPVTANALTCRVPDIDVTDLLSFLVRTPASAYKAAKALGFSLSTAYAKATRARQHGFLETQGHDLYITVRGLIYCLCKSCEERRLVLERIMQRYEIKTEPAYVEAYIYMLLKALDILSIPLTHAPVERLCSSATLLLTVLNRTSIKDLYKSLRVDKEIFSAAMPVLAEGLARLGLAVDLGTHYYFPSLGVVVCKRPCNKESCNLSDETTKLKRKIKISLHENPERHRKRGILTYS